ncbi:MAG TPA: DoxX family protein [Steroidobacteraceae bacterium]|nr:DoxX family protein [Steroidobacteraceae bacterium]
MVHLFSIWLIVVAFFGAGLFNAIGTKETKSGFVRWGYPRWWNIPTGALEMTGAVLIAFPATRLLGLVLGAVIIAGALITVLRHRDFSHLVPIGVFVAMIALAATDLGGRH